MLVVMAGPMACAEDARDDAPKMGLMAPAPLPTCSEECVEVPCDGKGGPCLTLVLKYVVNTAHVGPPTYSTFETFTEENFGSYDAAYCFARKIRREGRKLPGTYPVESNIMPESITPMPVI
jgi:hypothetical protein